MSLMSARGLVEITDPEFPRPVFRQSGFDGILTAKEMDEKISAWLKKTREAKGISRADLAHLLGLSVSVYARYERGSEARMSIPRLIHLCEIMGFMPLDMIFDTAPHLWGKTPEEAEERRTLTRLIERLPADTMRDLIRLLKRMTPGEEGAEALANISEGG
ncbi:MULTISPECIES: helix-turn-helix transcriptional regulator [Sinorhizobium]|uniref:helix-turn-helix transcriptional regulator n=1 Tax=Sinorhizobium TaxID=28105 RepID=UPI0013E3296C|nr:MULTISPECIES: helix-turn-helix transcriptional regulator [Sinorhizobium]MBO1965326.1 helix-turn-helix transcriptional regulator [Sinorhizobium medicae]WQO56905.1 helix-turn-helix transcriptional regulator [Sinorhizobium medicae]WQP41157.1 helix-turn-helix transcriptional regulator [Sinorhizobium medicae]